MLQTQVTPRAPPNGSSYQTLPTATSNHNSFCAANGIDRRAKGQEERGGVGVREEPGKGKVTKAWKSVGRG